MSFRMVLGGFAMLVVSAGGNSPRASDFFEKPERLMADGQIIDTGKQWGHSSPCLEDLDGDGLTDLLVGDFSGKFRVFRNVGQKNQPVYKDVGLLKAGASDASVKIYCCVGAQARFVDLNGDGVRDFISSSYDPGHCYFFSGLPKHQFVPGVELVDKTNTPIRSAPQQKQKVDSFGSFYAPVDWDADGDFDLLIGCFNGELKLRINEGNSKKPHFSDKNVPVNAGDAPLKVDLHCCPVVADWDGDGRWDLIAGSNDGSVTWFRNVGSKNTPRFDNGVVLVEKHSSQGGNVFPGESLLRWNESDIVPGIRSQVDVIDYNSDGKLDLAVGDFCTAYHPKPDLDARQKKELEKAVIDADATRKQIADQLHALGAKLEKQYPGALISSEEGRKASKAARKTLIESGEYKSLQTSLDKSTQQIRPLLAPSEANDVQDSLSVPHGYVWLFTRK